jgi:hypothetical protein
MMWANALDLFYLVRAVHRPKGMPLLCVLSAGLFRARRSGVLLLFTEHRKGFSLLNVPQHCFACRPLSSVRLGYTSVFGRPLCLSVWC